MDLVGRSDSNIVGEAWRIIGKDQLFEWEGTKPYGLGSEQRKMHCDPPSKEFRPVRQRF